LFLLLGVTSGTCGFLNILILSWGVLGCCGKGIGAFNCVAASLGVAQVGLQWTCFAVMSVSFPSSSSNRTNINRLLLFLIYFQRSPSLGAPSPTSSTPSSKTATTVTIVSVLHLVVLAAISFYFSLLHNESEIHKHPSNSPPPPSQALTSWANFLGIQATLLASLQYIPQIWTTWRLKHVGSLSILMMCIQTPGSFIWAISLASREGTKWSSWVIYIVTGILQGCLLVMCIVWEIKDRAARKKLAVDGSASNGTASPEEEERDGERRPLLANET
jgi:uncharacterized protein with PQ loop repeat